MWLKQITATFTSAVLTLLLVSEAVADENNRNKDVRGGLQPRKVEPEQAGTSRNPTPSLPLKLAQRSPAPAASSQQPPPRREDQVPSRRPNPPTVQDNRGMSTGAVVGTAAGAAVAGILLGRMTAKPQDIAKVLDKEGPQIPPAFLMSTLTVRGFVRGSWPVVLEYAVDPNSLLLLSVTSDAGIEFIYRFPAGAGRTQHLFTLPVDFGNEPNPATYSLRALTNNPQGSMAPVALRVYGFGAGYRAVGSVGLDQLRFGPATVRRKKENAQYGFHSRNGFQEVMAEFMKVGRANNIVVATLQESDKVDRAVRENDTLFPLTWKPKKDSTVGNHLLQLRGWMSKKKGGDWVLAWSDDMVNVSE